MKRQSKKESKVIDKFKNDTKGMTSSQIFEYMGLSEAEKEKYVQNFRSISPIPKIIINDKNKNKSKKESPSSLIKKEREKGFRAERIWIKGNNAISRECKNSNDVRNSAQFFERENYFKNRDLLREKRQEGEKDFKINKKDRYISYQDLDKMKDKVEFIDDNNGIQKDKYKKFKDAYRSMSMACLSQQTLVLVADSWEGYFEGLFGFLKGDPNYTGKPNIPGYGDKGDEYIVVIPDDRFKIISGQDVEDCWSGDSGIRKKVNTLAFEPGLSYLKLDGLKTTLTDKDNIRELRIVPIGIGYFVEIIYKMKEDERKKKLLTTKEIDKDGNYIIKEIELNPNIVGGIDLGLRNIVTKGFVEIDINGDKGKAIGQPICFKGGILKSMNQYYNKRRSEIQSIYEHQVKNLKKRLRHLKFQYNVKTKDASKEARNQLYKEIQSVKGQLKKIRTGPALRKLEFNRKKKIEDVMHKYSRYIINDSIENRSGMLVIGHNKGQKQSIELGKITNQNFVFIPFYKLIKMICEEVEIKVIVREESHTSKCSVIDWESVEHHERYLGKRISRGLFRSARGIIINADVQGYNNIIRKRFNHEAINSKEIEENKVFPKINKIDGIEGVRLHPVRVNPLMSRVG